MPGVFFGEDTGISTHAPREGSDSEIGMDVLRIYRFQPTLPARGATAYIDKNTSEILYISDKLQSSYRALARQMNYIAAIHLKKEASFRCEPPRLLMFSIASHH